MANCWPPCSFPTCYVTDCTAANTVAYSTTMLRATLSAVSAAGIIHYQLEHWDSTSQAWLPSPAERLQEVREGCLVHVSIESAGVATTFACGNATTVTIAPPTAHGEQASVRVEWQIGLNALGLCVAEYHPALGTYPHYHAQATATDPCEVFVDVASTFEVGLSSEAAARGPTAPPPPLDPPPWLPPPLLPHLRFILALSMPM